MSEQAEIAVYTKEANTDKGGLSTIVKLLNSRDWFYNVATSGGYIQNSQGDWVFETELDVEQDRKKLEEAISTTSEVERSGIKFGKEFEDRELDGTLSFYEYFSATNIWELSFRVPATYFQLRSERQVELIELFEIFIRNFNPLVGYFDIDRFIPYPTREPLETVPDKVAGLSYFSSQLDYDQNEIISLPLYRATVFSDGLLIQICEDILNGCPRNKVAPLKQKLNVKYHE